LHRQIPQYCKYITVLRDPIERIISLYHHHLHENHTRTDKNAVIIQSQLKSGEITLADFVSSGISPQTDNCQTRFLSGELPGFGQCTGEMLEKAKNNLREHFIVAGLTERFDESVLLMQKALKWTTPCYVKQNISSQRSQKEEIDQATLETILRFNELDTELYNFAQELLEGQIEQQGAGFEKELEEFRTAIRLFEEKSRKWRSIKKGLSISRNIKRFVKLKISNLRRKLV